MYADEQPTCTCELCQPNWHLGRDADVFTPVAEVALTAAPVTAAAPEREMGRQQALRLEALRLEALALAD